MAGHVCGRCQRQPPAFERTHALFRYAPPVDRLVQALKYQRRLDIAPVLSTMLAADLGTPSPRPDVIVPVPLHTRRLRERGYNQSLELARPLARQLGIALDYRCVRRIRPTAPQVGLSLARRRGNVRGAFAAVRPERLAGKRVAIVDDVMTSGYTADALAHCLRRAGTVAVEVWVVARAGGAREPFAPLVAADQAAGER